jgi:aldehyde dehydrogenase (NAD+)
VGEYARGSVEDTKSAIAAAKSAFPAWARSGILERHAILRKTADEIVARRDEIGCLLSREEGKTLAEGIGETVRASQIFDFFAGECLRLAGELLPSVRPNIGVEITREPVGVVGNITPWNFPIAIPAWKIAPALCYGNTVIFKPAELVPGCSWAIVDIIARAGLPKGALNLVMGQSSVVGQAMLDSPDVHPITFTGSTGTGKRVATASVEHNRKYQLEMAARILSSCLTMRT